VGRLVDQKGWDLVAEVMRRWVNEMDVQWAILGTGEPLYHDLLGEMSRNHPDRVVARLEFSDPLAHQFEAGADIFLMPSRYEPCGLNQLYSLKYGSVPVVRSTGGLADTVVAATPETTENKSATGFVFDEYLASALDAALRQAVATYWQDPAVWQQLVETGMRQDWSWGYSATTYLEAYAAAKNRHREARERVKVNR
jgi:starch synthase